MSRQRRVGGAVWDEPDVRLPINYSKEHKCPHCKQYVWARGELGPDSRLDIKCKRCGKHFQPAKSVGRDEKLPINRCPNCTDISSVGEFGEGTALVTTCRKCKRDNPRIFLSGVSLS